MNHSKYRIETLTGIVLGYADRLREARHEAERYLWTHLESCLRIVRVGDEREREWIIWV